MSDNSLLDKLNHLVTRFEEIGTLITDPTVIGDMKRFVKLNKEYRAGSDCMPRNEYKLALDSIEEAKKILRASRQRPASATTRSSLSIPETARTEEQIAVADSGDPEDDKNVIRRSVVGQVAMKRRSAGDHTRCIPVIAEARGGRPFPSHTEGTAEVSRRSSLPSPAKRCTAH